MVAIFVYDQPMKNMTLKKALFYLAVAMPIALHFILLYRYTVNAPRLDDFSEILTFLPDWHAASNSSEKMAILFRDYQNHRYVLYHGLLVFYDHINFRTAAIIGNLPLLALCALMLKSISKHPYKKILWLITPLLIFNLQTWRAMFWGPLGTTNLLYPTVGLMACWLATKGKYGIVAAGCTAILLTLSHGSGPLLFPVIAAYLWLQMKKEQCSSNLFINWILFSGIALWLYFVTFPLQGEAGYSSHNSMELFLTFFARAPDVIKGFLAIVGSPLLINDIHYPWKNSLAILLGTIELLWLSFLITRGTLRNSPALLLWLAFLLLAVASIAVGRVAYGGMDQALQGHYKLLNGLLLWFLAMTTLQWVDTHHPVYRFTAAVTSVSIATVLYISSLVLFLTPMQTFQQALLDDVMQWQQSGNLKNPETRLFVRQFNRKLKTAIEGGFYNPNE